LPWQDIIKLINRSGCCNTYINENRIHSSALSGSEYIYLCARGTYKHLKYLDTKINVEKYGWKKNNNLFSRKEISYTGISNACSILCDPALSNSKNIEKIREIFLITDQVASVILGNWKSSLKR
jgi:hypothetical protein